MATLSGERWRALSGYLDQALDMDAEQRDPWLATLRLENPSVADDLASLLQAQHAIARDRFLEGGVSTQVEQLLRESLESSRQVLAADHVDVGAGWNIVGLSLLEKGDYAGAEPMLRQALAIRRKNFGKRHPSVAINLHNLGVSLREQGRFAEARAVLEEGLAVAREAAGNRDITIARLLYQLARIDLAEQDATTAETRLRDALQRQQRAWRADDWRTAATRSALGETLTALRRYQEAEHLLIEANAVLKDVPGRQGREAAATRARLAALQVQLKGR